MKRLLFICLLIGLTLLSVGCKKNTPPAEPSTDLPADAGQFIEQSQSLADEMAQGQYEPTVALFSPALASLDATKLRQSWDSTVKDLGAYAGLAGTPKASVQDQYLVIEVTLNYSVQNLLVRFVYNTDRLIEGLWLNYAAKPTAARETDTFKEIDIQVGDPKAPLNGRLTLPVGRPAGPVVILIQGSGPNDMDETIGQAGNKPFFDLAAGLAQNGIATIRYNKRTQQYAPTSGQAITIQTEVIDDVLAAVDLAAHDSRVQSDQVFILGHSLGGMVAPAIASADPRIKGLISLAGSPRPLEDIIIDQNRESVESQTDKTAAEKSALIAQVEAEAAKVKALTATSPSGTIFGAPSAYWYSLSALNTQATARRLTIPMLFLQGEADFQVDPIKDFGLWKTLLADRPSAQFKSYPNLNHLFMETTGHRDISDYNAPAQVDPQVIADIAEFVHASVAAGR